MNEITQTAIEEAVIAAYASMDEVVSIYLINEGYLLFYVFANEQSYNDALLDRLIDAKIPILDTYSKAVMDFRFAPLVLSGPPINHLGPWHKCIFERST